METATTLFTLQTQISQAASASEIQEQTSLEHEAREKASGRSPAMWTVGVSTLFYTRAASLESKRETVTIPRALELLQGVVNALVENYRHGLREINVRVVETQQKSHRDYDRSVKERHSKVDASNAAYAKEISKLKDAINSLQETWLLSEKSAQGLSNRSLGEMRPVLKISNKSSMP
jgi:hypothetical protein